MGVVLVFNAVYCSRLYLFLICYPKNARNKYTIKKLKLILKTPEIYNIF